MKVAIDVSPLTSGHKVRGVGFYLKHLLDALKTYYPEHEYVEFTDHVPANVGIVHYPYFDPFSFTLSFFGRKKTVVTIHDLTPFVMPTSFPIGIKGKLQWFLQQLAIKKVNSIITDSKASKKDIEKILTIPSSRIHVVYLAAGKQFRVIHDKKMLFSALQKYHLPTRFALYVGDGTPNKNVLRLVQAALRTHIPLVIAGKVFTDATSVHPWAKDIREVQNLARANPEKIVLLGFVPDEELVALYNRASVFVMPSLSEGFGLPILEAMACGCPVVASSKGSLPEVAGNAAFLIDPYSTEEIAKAIEKVVGDSKLAKTLTVKGLEQAKKFSWKKTADATIEVYKVIK